MRRRRASSWRRCWGPSFPDVPGGHSLVDWTAGNGSVGSLGASHLQPALDSPADALAQSRLLSDARILAGYLIFFGSYFVFALGKFPWTKIDRPGAAIIGAVLMVAFRIVGAQEALASIDFATIVLLFSMMLIVANLRIVGFFDWITELAPPR